MLYFKLLISQRSS